MRTKKTDDKVFVRHVTSNVKGQDGWTETLGDRTLLVGPNGSGKSAIVNAVELALTGTVSDIAGRASVTNTADLLSLAPGTTGTLWSRIELSDGTTATWTADGSGGRAKAPDRNIPTTVWAPTVLPLRAVREALLGSPGTARRFILSHAIPGQSVNGSAGLTDLDISCLFPAHHAERYLGLAGAETETSNPIECLLAIQKRCGAEKRRCASELKGEERLAAQLGEGDTMPATDAEMEKARERVATAEHHEAEVRDLVQTHAQIKSMNERLQMLQASASGLVPIPEGEPRPASDGHRKVRIALAELLTFQAQIGADDCLVCGTEVGIDHLRRRYEHVAVQLQASVHAEAKRAEKERAAHELAQSHLVAQARIDQVVDQIQRRVAETIKETEGAIPPDPGAEGLERARLEAGEAREAHSEMRMRQALWDQVAQARDQVRDLREDGAEWKALETECKSVIQNLVDKSMVAFTEKVQSFLPATDTFKIQVRDGSRDVFRIGLVHGGALHTALSGAEWARVTAAVAGACIPEGAPLAVVIPEDRAWDGATLAATMRAFSKIPAQVIITSTTKPAGRKPKGWTIINTENVREPVATNAPTNGAGKGVPA